MRGVFLCDANKKYFKRIDLISEKGFIYEIGEFYHSFSFSVSITLKLRSRVLVMLSLQEMEDIRRNKAYVLIYGNVGKVCV